MSYLHRRGWLSGGSTKYVVGLQVFRHASHPVRIRLTGEGAVVRSKFRP